MIPNIDKRAVCIIDDDFILATKISSYFNKPGHYFTLFKFRAAKEKTDDLVATIVKDRGVIYIQQRIYQVKPDKVIFAGLTDYQISCFDDVPDNVVLKINPDDNLDEKLSFLETTLEEMQCSEEDILTGLFLSKKLGKKLTINNESSALNLEKYKSDNIVFIEDIKDIDNVMAINYAFSINSDLIIVKPFIEGDLDNLKRQLSRLPDERREYIKKITKKIHKRVRSIKFSKYQFATFFTEGLPYGLLLNNILPTSHVMRKMPDYFLFDNIFNENNNKNFGSALMFAPGNVGEEDESAKVIEIFKDKNYFVKDLLK